MDYKAKQGNVGVGCAIYYFTSKGSTVSIPLNDTQGYDLVVDIEGVLKKVQVKTTTYMVRQGCYGVGLKSSGGNSYFSGEEGKYRIKSFDNTACDYMFILTGDGTQYLIPYRDIEVKSMLTLNHKYDRYIVNVRKLNNVE